MLKKNILIDLSSGVHTRIAAMIVLKASEIKSKYNVNLYLKKLNSNSEPFGISMLALLSLKIKQGDSIELSSREENDRAQKALNEMYDFICEDLISNNNMSQIDELIEQNTIANEQIISNMPIGILVVDTNSRIVTINNYSLNLIKKSPSEVYGKYVKDIIPTSDLPLVIKEKKRQIGKVQHIEDKIVIANRTPILGKNNELLGAMGIFQDISEVIGIKELNEKLNKILEASHDLICFVDEHRKLSYLNPAYENYFNINKDIFLGSDLKDISPKGLRMKVFKSKEKIENILHKKGKTRVVSTIEPIFIDKEFKGIISISKPLSEMKDLLNKLEKSQEEIEYYKDEIRRQANLTKSFKDIIGNSGSLKEVLYIAEKASISSSTVLIRGESGTGKEVIAKSIHYNGTRKNKPFVRVNCAAIPENLLESELFGYEKGSFTGALKSKPGKFLLAHGGTIFLDEIGDMPVSMQVKLLRVLQEKEFESIGGIKTQKVDVRVIAATNRDLESMIKDNTFREDLYYRLNVINITLPPLKDRKEDINLLVEHFIEKLNKSLNKNVRGITRDCILYLEKYHWPGNIRELENIIERAMNMCDGNLITPKDLPFHITNISSKNDSLINLVNGELLSLEEYEKEIVKIAMKKYGSYNRAAKALGVTHRTVSLKCKKYNIE
ncbi:sigma 54-interacting transcriptional regulator [Haloimpatiens sp. FM7315]|uniref:sigma 54-interacting transcriptional regulator n=1 Tax=Haloimpatiens sp. FM7315 TaxID=3298609 RepID=UPI00370C1BB3